MAGVANATNATCVLDVDCPGPFLCYEDVPWDDEPNFCGCSTWYGKTGERCDGLSTNSIVLLAVSSTAALLGFGLLVVALKDVAATLRTFGWQTEASASNSTLVFTTLALLFFEMWQLSYIVENVLPWEGWVLQPYPEGNKESFFKRITSLGIVGLQTFSFLASLNVSVMWVEMSQRARKMTPKMTHNVSRYKRACLIVGLLFAFLMAGVAASGKLEFGLVVALPFLLGLAVCFIVGRMRMVDLLKEAISRSGESSTGTSTLDRKNKTAAYRTRRTMHAIKVCSTRVIAGLVVTVLAGVSFFLALQLAPGSWKSICPDGGFCPPALVGQILPIATLYLLLSVLTYSHRNTHKLIRRARGVVAPGDSSAGNSKTGDVEHTTVPHHSFTENSAGPPGLRHSFPAPSGPQATSPPPPRR